MNCKKATPLLFLFLSINRSLRNREARNADAAARSVFVFRNVQRRGCQSNCKAWLLEAELGHVKDGKDQTGMDSVTDRVSVHLRFYDKGAAAEFVSAAHFPSLCCSGFGNI